MGDRVLPDTGALLRGASPGAERSETVLDEAARLVDGDRESSYGHPADDFARIAAMWSAILGCEVKPWQVGACMIATKLSRAVESPTKRDHWVDVAGYARTVEKVHERADRG